jgi:hypothetical protein
VVVAVVVKEPQLVREQRVDLVADHIQDVHQVVEDLVEQVLVVKVILVEHLVQDRQQLLVAEAEQVQQVQVLISLVDLL